MYETTADLMQDWCDARIDADLEMAEFVAASRQREQDIADGYCPHDSGVMFRPIAFYPQQVGLTQGQIFCYDCQAPRASESAVSCVVCDLDIYNCMGERGVAGGGKFAHDAFVTPPMILVSVAPEGGF